MGWVVTAGVLLVLWFLPLCVSAGYDDRGAAVLLLVGPLRFKLYPCKIKTAKQRKEKLQPDSDTVDGNKNIEKHAGGRLTDFLPLVKTALQLLDALRRKLTIKNMELKLILAGGDPCDLSINYGRAWAAVGNLFPSLTRIFVIKKRNVEVLCDYVSEETRVIARADISITLGRLLSIVIYYGIRGLKQYFKIINQRKGGANT